MNDVFEAPMTPLAEEAAYMRIGGFTYRAIGAALNCSHEWVRQILAPFDLEEPLLLNKEADWLTEREQAQKNSIRCMICEGPVLLIRKNPGPKILTCGPACAQAWISLRWFFNEDERVEHRRQCAKTVLKGGVEKYGECQVRSAQRVIDGTAERRGPWISSEKTVEMVMQLAPHQKDRVEELKSRKLRERMTTKELDELRERMKVDE